jgi:hypothetical protein
LPEINLLILQQKKRGTQHNNFNRYNIALLITKDEYVYIKDGTQAYLVKPIKSITTSSTMNDQIMLHSKSMNKLNP